MKPLTLDILSEVASASRDRVLSCIQRNIGHPEAIARELDLSRAAVDNHLAALTRIGVLHRYNVQSQGNKPKTYFGLTEDGKKFVEDIEMVVEAHRRRLGTSRITSIERLEASFLKGEISEDKFRQGKKRIEERYSCISDV